MRKHISLFLSAVFLLTGCSAKIVQNEPKPADNTVYTRDSAGIRLEDDFYGYMNFDLLYGADILKQHDVGEAHGLLPHRDGGIQLPGEHQKAAVDAVGL